MSLDVRKMDKTGNNCAWVSESTFLSELKHHLLHQYHLKKVSFRLKKFLLKRKSQYVALQLKALLKGWFSFEEHSRSGVCHLRPTMLNFVAFDRQPINYIAESPISLPHKK